MASVKPTKRQKQLIDEIKELSWLFGLDYETQQSYSGVDRTTHLEIVRNKIVRGQIVIWYALVDEWLNTQLCYYFFGRKRDFKCLWRTKKFQNFNYYFLEELSLMQKLRFVKAITKIPKAIAADIERLNVIRNGVAHALFPDNLRKSKPIWKGKDVFALDGAKLLHDDMHKVWAFFRNLLDLS